MNTFYRTLRAIISLLLRVFYRIEPPQDPAAALAMEGPVMFVGNHPNGMVDPALVFALAQRHVTFLAKAPLFSMPILGALIKGLGALPVYRKQDDPSQMGKNAGTLEAAAGALAEGRCITLFPEGKSHSEPQLQELKTGAARIALMAVKLGARVRIVPLGLTYSEKGRFRSSVRVDVGAPIDVKGTSDEHEAAVALTQEIFEGLHSVTLNLGKWEDLPLISTAEALYALKTGAVPSDPERLRAFARGMELLRTEQPERFERLKAEVLAVQRQLALVNASPEALSLQYRFAQVARFTLRNLFALALLPAFLLGMVLFAIPYWIPPLFVRVFKVQSDIEATFKLLGLVLLTPVWLGVVTFLAFEYGGVPAGVAALLGTLPLALFTRYYFERRAIALRDARTFFVLGRRSAFKQQLVAKGEALAAQIETVAQELQPRVART